MLQLIKTMNKQILTFFLGIFILSCNKIDSTDYIIISGKISNQQLDKVKLANNKDTFTIDVVTNNFSDTLMISEGYYNLIYGEQENLVYLKPGFDIQIQFVESLKFTGKGAEENNYLMAKAALSNELQKYLDYKYYAQLNENDFLSLMDSIYDLQITLINEGEKQFASEFNFIEKNKLKYKSLSEKALYEVSRRIVTENKDLSVSPGYYPNLFKNIDVNDKRLINNEDYLSFINSYIFQTTKGKLKNNDSIDFLLAYMEVLNNEVSDSIIKEKLSFDTGNIRLDRTNKLDEVFQLISANITNKDYYKKVESKYKTLKKVEKGAISPTFRFKDINGKEVTLENLRGKIVYIDIWSTGCPPCMAEIPYQNKLEKYCEGKNIYLVGINVGDEEEHWKNTVKEKNIGGIQLHAPNTKVDFFKDYLVRGIPRYILIDIDGTIISSSAGRPSDSKLKEQLDKIL